jgi:two-component system, LuxR family, sensor kinase FixL
MQPRRTCLLQVAESGPNPAWQAPWWGPLRAAFLTGVAYYAGAKLGLALTFEPVPVSVLWPPNALLLGAMVLTRKRWWWALIAGALPAHLLAELQEGVPLAMVLCWFISNTVEALLGATLVCRLSDAPHLRSLRSAVVFCCAGVVAPFLVSFLDTALVRLVGWGAADYAAVWYTRFSSNLLATLAFAPVILTWGSSVPDGPREGSRAQLLEICALVMGLLAVSVMVFDSAVAQPSGPPALLYLPLPFLIWAAVRFGPALTSAGYALVVLVALWSASGGHKLLVASTTAEHIPLQLLLISMGVPLLLLAAVMEERRATERKLRTANELFDTAFQHGPDAMAIARQSDGVILRVNDRWLQLIGSSDGGAAEASTLMDHLDDASKKHMRALLADPASRRELEVELLDRHEGPHRALLSVKAFDLDGEPCHISVLRDVTQLRQAEKEARDQQRQLTHLTRVASLSHFSSTIAHELNQPLTAILSNAQAAQRLLSRDPPNVAEVRTILSEIAEADKRAGQLIHHLRRMMKDSDTELVPVNVNDLISEVLHFVRGECLPQNIEVKTIYATDLPSVRGDPVQLQQLLINLVLNACEAMRANQFAGHSSALRISTAAAPEGGVQVVVTDTGPGIAPDRLERVFEPFFTTKESGLGMGLAICRRIARAHGGTLTVWSQAGEGASFRLFVPSVAQENPAALAGARLKTRALPRSN